MKFGVSKQMVNPPLPPRGVDWDSTIIGMAIHTLVTKSYNVVGSTREAKILPYVMVPPFENFTATSHYLLPSTSHRNPCFNDSVHQNMPPIIHLNFPFWTSKLMYKDTLKLFTMLIFGGGGQWGNDGEQG